MLFTKHRDGPTLHKARLAEKFSVEGHERRWPMLFLTVLPAVALGLMLLLAYMALQWFPEKDAATVDTLPTFHYTKPSMTMVTPPRWEFLLPPRNLSTITVSEHGHVFPSSQPSENECSDPACRSLAQWLRSHIDFNVDPCKDFYKYVCGSFRGSDTFSQVTDTIAVATRAGIITSEIPRTNQLAWQKAAAMYKACVSFASSYLPETIELVRWMISMNLDFINTTRLLSVNPVEVMVRGSLDLGVHALISITLDKTKFTSGKRVMTVDYSKEQDGWLQRRSLEWLSTILSDYSLYLQMYGMRRKDVYRFAGKIRRYETELEYIARGAVDWEPWEFVSISKLDQYTFPYVTSGQWGAFFSMYTNGTYTEHDKIVHFIHSTRIIQKLYENENVGTDGLRYLVAWGIYRQLAEFTEPYLFRGERSAENSCYVHVKNVMNLAVINRYFLKVVPPRMVSEAKDMASRIRKTFEAALKSSSWVDATIRQDVIKQLNNITVYVGSPGRRLNPEFVEEFYRPLPDVPLNRTFPSWIKARSISTHYVWTDQSNVLYDEEDVNAYYMPGGRYILVPTAIMHPPFMYADVPRALNYGSLGMIIAHEFMHPFDVIHIRRHYWETPTFKKEYTKRALCLRRSHRSVLSLTSEEDTLNDVVDSENLADLVGAMVAHQAFLSLPPNHKNAKLAGLNMSSEQLYFISHCATWCADNSIRAKRYAPYRSRCMVPLRNMPEFSRAFNCKIGTIMNPQQKCSFW